MRMDICLCSDDNYAKYMATTIASILSNSKENEELYFHLIIDNDFTDDSKKKILSLKKIKDCEIKFYTPDVEKYKKWFEVSLVKHLSAATFYRLDIHRLIPDIDKVLYLDSDIIVRDSLKEFFEKEINDYYALCVKEKMHINNIELRKKLEFDKDDFYFNAGVLMINLSLWRENKIEDKFIEYWNKNYNNAHGDQDLLNFCLKGKVYDIGDNWNFFPLKGLNNKLTDDVKIIHFITFKPWEYYKKISFEVDEFWKYYQLTPWFLERPIDAIQTILAQKYGDYEDTKLKINDVKFLGIYHNRNTLEIVIFFIKIRVEMSFENINKIAWWIPIKKLRESFRRTFDI